MEDFKCFFSYAREDTDFVLKLAKELRSVGADLWLDQLDILGGQHWDHTIEEALKSCQGMIAVLSPDSVESKNVMDEVSYALEEGKLVIPVLVRACDIPFRLRRVQHIDFTADYEKGFSQLRRALRIEPSSQQAEPAMIEKPPADVPIVGEREFLEAPAIDTSLPSAPVAPPPPEAPSVPDTSAAPDTSAVSDAQPGVIATGDATASSGRWRSALIGGAAGAAFGTIAMLGSNYSDEWFVGTGIVGIPWAIAGAMSGRERRVAIAAMSGAAIGFGLWALICLMGSYEFVYAATLGAPSGALLGAIVGVVLKKRKG